MPYRFLFVLLLAGCAATPTEKTVPESTLTTPGMKTPVEGVDRLLARAERTASLTRSSELRADAAWAALKQKNIDQAARILETIPDPFSSAELTRKYLTAMARVALATGNAERALEYLNDPHLQSVPLTRDFQIQTGRLRSEAYRQVRSYIASARERIYFDSLLDPGEKAENHEAIFSTLLELPARNLADHAARAITSDLRGWLSLAAMTKQYQNDPVRQLEELNNWKKVWSHHPAAALLPAGLRMLSVVVSEQPAAIGLLLPLQGELGQYGRAIRDGILAAHYDAGNAAAIRIYDTSINTPRELLASAVADGAELIIGPLTRENVSSLAVMNLPVPVVALNRTMHSESNPDLYQFGLAPEDEMIQVADQVIRDGFRRGLVIGPEGAWGDRNIAAFRSRWEARGGTTIEEARFSSRRDYSDLVKTLLKVDESQQRANDLRRIIGQRFEFTPRRRQDIDFIFLLANPEQARSIHPTLAFFYADDVPVYATSHVHEITESRIDAIDLNGIRFCDIPWKLSRSGRLQQRVQALWNPASLEAFYALGVDAYHLYPRLQQLKEIPGQKLFGATGVLTLQNNLVVRHLMWAQFRNGEVVPVPLVLDEG